MGILIIFLFQTSQCFNVINKYRPFQAIPERPVTDTFLFKEEYQQTYNHCKKGSAFN